MTMALVLIILVVLLIVGVPVAISMAVSGAFGLYMFGGLSILTGILRTAPLSSTSSYEIITVPMFILMAEFVIISGIAKDRKSTRLNSSHVAISYAVFCLKKK